MNYTVTIILDTSTSPSPSTFLIGLDSKWLPVIVIAMIVAFCVFVIICICINRIRHSDHASPKTIEELWIREFDPDNVEAKKPNNKDTGDEETKLQEVEVKTEEGKSDYAKTEDTKPAKEAKTSRLNTGSTATIGRSVAKQHTPAGRTSVPVKTIKLSELRVQFKLEHEIIEDTNDYSDQSCRSSVEGTDNPNESESDDVLPPPITDLDIPDTINQNDALPPPMPDSADENGALPPPIPDSVNGDDALPPPIPDSVNENDALPPPVPDSSDRNDALPPPIPESANLNDALPSPIPDSANLNDALPPPMPDSAILNDALPPPIPDSSDGNDALPPPMPDSVNENDALPPPIPDFTDENDALPPPMPDSPNQNDTFPQPFPDLDQMTDFSVNDTEDKRRSRSRPDTVTLEFLTEAFGDLDDLLGNEMEEEGTDKPPTLGNQPEDNAWINNSDDIFASLEATLNEELPDDERFDTMGGF